MNAVKILVLALLCTCTLVVGSFRQAGAQDFSGCDRMERSMRASGGRLWGSDSERSNLLVAEFRRVAEFLDRSGAFPLKRPVAAVVVEHVQACGPVENPVWIEFPREGSIVIRVNTTFFRSAYPLTLRHALAYAVCESAVSSLGSAQSPRLLEKKDNLVRLCVGESVVTEANPRGLFSAVIEYFTSLLADFESSLANALNPQGKE